MTSPASMNPSEPGTEPANLAAPQRPLGAPAFRGARSGLLRLWHWLTVLSVTGLASTWLLRMTFLNFRGNALLIQQKLQEQGISLDDEKARALARVLRDGMWEWHYRFGFVLVALLVLRFVVRERLPFRGFKGGSLEYRGAKILQALFYVVVCGMAMSGLVIYFRETLGLPRGLAGALKEAHEVAAWYIVVYAVAHIGGVVFAEQTHSSGLVSDMIGPGSAQGASNEGVRKSG